MTEAHAIRVMVVDDHPMLHAGMRNFLDAFYDLELVGEATSGEEALALCALVQPDVILMDMLLPDMDGVAATQAIKQRYPQVQIIALTSYREGDLIKRVLRTGAIGYLLKTVSAFDLAQAIRAAYAGRPVLAREVSEALVVDLRAASGPGSDLTEREREVLQLVVRGLSNAQIAEQLHIAPATVKFHITGIFSKLGVSRRSEAIALAYQHQLVPKPA